MSGEANGLSALCERIINDAKSDAERIASEAAKEIASIKKRSDSNIEKLQTDYEAKRKIAIDEILDHSRTSAQLEGRKQLLSKRREMLDIAYSTAYKKLCALRGEDRYALLLRLLRAEAAGGETVHPAHNDKEIIKKVIDIVNKELTTPLVLGEPDSKIDGGFLLKAADYDKNCSFEAIIDEVRRNTETEVAKKLFG